MATYTITTGSHVTITSPSKTIDCAKNSMLYLVDESAIVNFYTRGAKAPTISVRLGDTTVNGTMMTRDNVDSLLSSIFASGGGSTVSWSQVLDEGTKIAQISIDGVSTDVYAPNGGGSLVVDYAEIEDMTDEERAELALIFKSRYDEGNFDDEIINFNVDPGEAHTVRLKIDSVNDDGIEFAGLYGRGEDQYTDAYKIKYVLYFDGHSGSLRKDTIVRFRSVEGNSGQLGGQRWFYSKDPIYKDYVRNEGDGGFGQGAVFYNAPSERGENVTDGESYGKIWCNQQFQQGVKVSYNGDVVEAHNWGGKTIRIGSQIQTGEIWLNLDGGEQNSLTLDCGITITTYNATSSFTVEADGDMEVVEHSENNAWYTEPTLQPSFFEVYENGEWRILSNEGSVVEWEQTVTVGTKIAEVTINGTSTDVYAPELGDEYIRKGSVSGFWKGTQAEYDALTTIDNNTIYFIV